MADDRHHKRREAGDGTLNFDASKDRWVAGTTVHDQITKRLLTAEAEATKMLNALPAMLAGDATPSTNMRKAGARSRW